MTDAPTSDGESGMVHRRPSKGAPAWLGRIDTWALTVAYSVLCVASLPPWGLWPLVFVVPVPLALLAVRSHSFAPVALPILIVQFATWLWLLRWIAPISLAGYPALALYLSMHTLLLVWVMRRIVQAPTFTCLPRVLLLSVTWTAMEYFRGEIAFNGYPWYMVGQPLIEWSSFVQSSDLFGMYFASFLAVLPAGLLLDALGYPHRMCSGAERQSLRRLSLPLLPAVGAIVMLIGNVVYGTWRNARSASGDEVRVLAVQTNLPQSNKIAWSVEQQAIDVPNFIRLTERGLAAARSDGRVDLIVWPETMVPSLGFEQQTLAFLERIGRSAEHLTIWARALERLALDKWGVPTLVGSNAWIEVSLDRSTSTLQRAREYNSAYLLQEGSAPHQRYDKVVLTPFGEVMPYISNWEWLEQRLLALGARGMQFNLDASPRINVLVIEPTGVPERPAVGLKRFVVGTPICFEDTVASLCRKMVYGEAGKRVHVLVNLSNEGWLGDSVADRILHAQIARFRCIENRVPMIRCANTGISMHIDSHGRVVQRSGASDRESTNVAGWLVADVQFDRRVTLFGRIGQVWPATCLVLTVGLIGWSMYSRVRHCQVLEESP